MEIILFDVILKMRVLEYACYEKCFLLGVGSQGQWNKEDTEALWNKYLAFPATSESLANLPRLLCKGLFFLLLYDSHLKQVNFYILNPLIYAPQRDNANANSQKITGQSQFAEFSFNQILHRL